MWCKMASLETQCIVNSSRVAQISLNRPGLNCSSSIMHATHLLFSSCRDQNFQIPIPPPANPRNCICSHDPDEKRNLPREGSGLSLHSAFHDSSDSKLCVDSGHQNLQTMIVYDQGKAWSRRERSGAAVTEKGGEARWKKNKNKNCVRQGLLAPPSPCARRGDRERRGVA